MDKQIIEVINKYKVQKKADYERCMKFYDKWMEYEITGKGEHPFKEMFKEGDDDNRYDKDK